MSESASDDFAVPEARSGEKWLTVLVHGVGDQRPGDMIDSVTRAIGTIQPDLPQSEEYVVVQFEDPAASDGRFPMFTRVIALPNGSTAIFGEVFWADLSRIRGGTFDLLVGLFRLIFGLRYVSDQAASQPQHTACLLRWLLYLTILVARGPLLTLFTLGALCCVPLAAQWAARTADISERHLSWLSGSGCYFVLGLAIAAIGLAMTIFALRRRGRFGAFGLWLFISSMTITIACNVRGLREYVNWIYDNQLVTGGSPACYLAIIIWLTDWVRDAAFVLLGISLVFLIPALVKGTPERRPGLAIAFVAAALQLLLWQIMLAPFQVALDFGLATVTATVGRDFVHDVEYYVGFRMFMVYSIALCILATWLARRFWVRQHQGARWPLSFPPRLIVSCIAEVWLLFISLVLVADVVSTAMEELANAHAYLSLHTTDPALKLPYIPAVVISLVNELYHPIECLAVPVWFLTIGALCYILLSENMIRNVLHVITDVVNHFYRPAQQFPVRRQIEARFHTVFRWLVDKHRPTRVTVVAHSQGTMIAFNALDNICSQAECEHLTNKIDVVTVGSPLTHLYQHYFPTQYPPQGDPKWQTLEPFVRRWKNIFRVDDFVGTFISVGSGDPKTQQWPKNISAKPGGHTDYWKADIFRHLTSVLP